TCVYWNDEIDLASDCIMKSGQISFTTIIVGGVGLTSKLMAIERPQCIAHRSLCFEFLNV
ncbi:MAG: hypothetical protein ACI4EX_06395, partial [Lachnospiraceae bacterium]